MNKPRGKVKSDSARWASVRAALARVLAGCPHKSCFLHGGREVLEVGHGGAALHYRQGEPVAAHWMPRTREYLPDRKMWVPDDHRLYCDDADARGLLTSILEGVQSGELEIPHDASVRGAGETVSAGTSMAQLSALIGKWIRETQDWSRRSGANAALVLKVKDARLVWVGIHLARGMDFEVDITAIDDGEDGLVDLH